MTFSFYADRLEDMFLHGAVSVFIVFKTEKKMFIYVSDFLTILSAFFFQFNYVHLTSACLVFFCAGFTECQECGPN